MNLQGFISKYQGKLVADPVGLYKGQCVSLAKQWLLWNKWPMLRGNAIDWQKNGDGKNYKFYYNTPAFVPAAGNLAVFAIYHSPYGHIGVVESADVHSMKVFNQNDPIGSPAHTTVFNFINPHCIGFLRKL